MSYTHGQDFPMTALCARINLVSSSSQFLAASRVPYKLTFNLAHFSSSPASQSSGGMSTNTGRLVGALKYARRMSMTIKARFVPPDAA
eukprot:16437773-Heterocapsa_arctica.AAC.2